MLLDSHRMAPGEKQSRKAAIEAADAELLATLGYKQEFQRAFTGLEVSCILISFGIDRLRLRATPRFLAASCA